MPIYEYKCPKCAKLHEVLVRSDSDIPEKCSQCGESGLIKQLSVFSVGAEGAGANPAASCGHECRETGVCPYAARNGDY